MFWEGAENGELLQKEKSNTMVEKTTQQCMLAVGSETIASEAGASKTIAS